MFHITDEGPKRCSAEKGGCPYLKEGAPHFETEKEAVQFYGKQLNENYGTFSPLKSKKNRSTPKRNQPKAAKVLQQFNNNAPTQNNTFITSYKNKLTTPTEEQYDYTQKMKSILSNF